MSRDLEFQVDDNICIDGDDYRVVGYIHYRNKTDHYVWVEYCLKSVNGGLIKWLSIDNTYGEYALYTQIAFGRELEDEQLQNDGFREADSGEAAVEACWGNVDADKGDRVRYTEYEDASEEKIVAIEVWEDETEYSKGYYLDFDEIVLLEKQNEVVKSEYPLKVSHEIAPVSGRTSYVKYVVIILIIVVIAIAAILNSNKTKTPMAKYLKGSSSYEYSTSITSDLNQKEKADVYATDLSVDLAVKDILSGIDGETEDVQQNNEDNTVAIITENEYGLIYSNEENQTMVQVSSRLFVYGSTNGPYRSTPVTSHYYRRYYYSRGFFNDSIRYKKYNSGYDNFDGDTVDRNTSDPYRSYSSSVRQSSVNTRSSSGGGISSGK